MQLPAGQISGSQCECIQKYMRAFLHCPKPPDSKNDILLLMEIELHGNIGKVIKTIRDIFNRPRPFFIQMPLHRPPGGADHITLSHKAAEVFRIPLNPVHPMGIGVQSQGYFPARIYLFVDIRQRFIKRIAAVQQKAVGIRSFLFDIVRHAPKASVREKFHLKPRYISKVRVFSSASSNHTSITAVVLMEQIGDNPAVFQYLRVKPSFIMGRTDDSFRLCICRIGF